MDEAASVSDRRLEHLAGARKRLEKWRYDTWLDLYSRRPWGYQAFLPDKVLTAVATKARFTTIDDLISGGWSPTHAQKHGTDVLDLLRGYDVLYWEFVDAEKEERARLRREETLAARNQKKIVAAAVKARAKELRAVARAAAPKAAPKPRPSRSKKARIEQENLPPAPNFPFLPHPPTPYTPVRTMDIGSLPHVPQTPIPPLVQPDILAPYMQMRTPVRHAFYMSPATPIPTPLNPYHHYSAGMNPPPHLQHFNLSLPQNIPSSPHSPSHFYGNNPTPQQSLPQYSRPQPRPAWSSYKPPPPPDSLGSNSDLK
jgi:hypothetical protein